MKQQIKIFIARIADSWKRNKSKGIYVGLGIGAVFLFCIYIASIAVEKTHIFHAKDQVSFEGGKIIGSTDAIYKKRDHLLSKSVKDLEKRIDSTDAKVTNIAQTLDEIVERLRMVPAPQQQPSAVQELRPAAGAQIPNSQAVQGLPFPGHDYPQQQGNTDFQTQQFSGNATGHSGSGPRIGRPALAAKGPPVISFPIKDENPQEFGVVIPSGSYVKSKVMTGIEAPEGKNYPVLLQLDYAFIGPNRTKVDLTGCFGIAKAQGDLSTERVQMQLTKMSCVSQKGKMFEREVNGFVADDKDNSFAVVGSVNSKQDRVAALAFLSSVVEGVGKAIQQAQTSQQTNAVGSTQTMVTGDQARYIGAGGVGSAASQVTQWYLQQAQNLLPTINIGSGQELWVVIQDKVELPNWYFRKADAAEKTVYSYFTNTVD